MKGKGASMHLTRRRAWGDGFLASSVRHADRRRRRVVGAVPRNEASRLASSAMVDQQSAAFHEALNLARCGNCPVVFCCENTCTMESPTPISAVTCGETTQRDPRSSYGLPRQVIDRQHADIYNQRRAATPFAKAREGRGPSLIECLTYGTAASRAPIRRQYARRRSSRSGSSADPVTLYRARLLAAGIPRGEARANRVRGDGEARSRDRDREGLAHAGAGIRDDRRVGRRRQTHGATELPGRRSPPALRRK